MKKHVSAMVLACFSTAFMEAKVANAASSAPKKKVQIQFTEQDLARKPQSITADEKRVLVAEANIRGRLKKAQNDDIPF